MTKINPDIHNTQKASDKSDVHKPLKKETQSGKSFSGILSEELNTGGKKTSFSTKEASLKEIENAAPARFSLTDAVPEQTDFGVESNLGLLEEYTSILMDPGRTLREAYETLDRLLKNTADMEEKMLNSDTEDTALKEIINHIAATVRKEQIKMDRGDYVDSS